VFQALYVLGLLGVVWDMRVAAPHIITFERYGDKETPKPGYETFFKKSSGSNNTINNSKKKE
jgi:hypothetical protein